MFSADVVIAFLSGMVVMALLTMSLQRPRSYRD